MNKQIHTPEGVRDIFGIECDRKRYIERTLEKLLRSYGYQSIETPLFEYLDVFGKEVGTTSYRDLYKFFDRDGETLALRPDFTPSVARAAATFFSEEDMPLRFCYSGNVFVNSTALQGRLRQSTQMGAELLNDDRAEADAEILALVVALMRQAGLTDFQITVGHVLYVQALCELARIDTDTREQLFALLASQNRYGARELIDRAEIPEPLKQVFLRLPELYGDADVLEEALCLAPDEASGSAVRRLLRIRELLTHYGCEAYVMYDLGMVTEFRYYTGVTFQAYTYGSGEPLVSGGRYDHLVGRFGKDAPAIGFTMRIDALLQTIARQRIHVPIGDIKTMILYAPELEDRVIPYAAREREQGVDAACIRLSPDKTLEDYKAYGLRNQFGLIRYFRADGEVVVMDLHEEDREGSS